MEFLASIAFLLGVVAYSASSALYFVILARGPSASVERNAARALGLGAAFHGAHVVFASLLSHLCPVASVHFGLSLTAFVLALGFLRLRSSRPIDALGMFVAPAALTFLVAAQFFVAPADGSTVSSALLILHIAANLGGLGFVLLAGATALLYLGVERRLKRKTWKSSLGRLPSLDGLDALGYRLLLSSLPLLTTGAVTGALFLRNLEGLGGLAFARAMLGYGAWGLVLAVVLLRSFGGFRGRKMAYGTVFGMAGLMLVLSAYLFLPKTGLVL